LQEHSNIWSMAEKFRYSLSPGKDLIELLGSLESQAQVFLWICSWFTQLFDSMRTGLQELGIFWFFGRAGRGAASQAKQDLSDPVVNMVVPTTKYHAISTAPWIWNCSLALRWTLSTKISYALNRLKD
jgi:hypothetical protein